VGTGHDTEVGATGDEDVVDVVYRRHRTHRHRGDPHLVADPVAEWGLVETAIFGTGVDRRLTARNVDQIAAVIPKGTPKLDSVVSVKASRHPVGSRDPH
jgi:hypothetical protein